MPKSGSDWLDGRWTPGVKTGVLLRSSRVYLGSQLLGVVGYHGYWYVTLIPIFMETSQIWVYMMKYGRETQSKSHLDDQAYSLNYDFGKVIHRMHTPKSSGFPVFHDHSRLVVRVISFKWRGGGTVCWFMIRKCAKTEGRGKRIYRAITRRIKA